jgi:hypothetical protein
MTLSRTKDDGKNDASRPVALGIATDGIAGILKRRPDDIADGLINGAIVVLVEVRGTGAAGPGRDRGPQSSATSQAASELMLGRTLLGDQVRDLRAVWRHLLRRDDVDRSGLIVAGGSGAAALPADAPFAHPRRIEGRPLESEPSGALLALLFGLFEDDTHVVAARNGLVSYRSVLDSPFVQVPLESIVPGVLREGDLPDLAAALVPREMALESLVDGRGRLAPNADAKKIYEAILRFYGEANPFGRVQFFDEPPKPDPN